MADEFLTQSLSDFYLVWPFYISYCWILQEILKSETNMVLIKKAIRLKKMGIWALTPISGPGKLKTEKS